MRFLFLVLPLFLACAGTLPTAPTVPDAKRVEKEQLPPDPENEPLDANVPRGIWVKSLEANSCAQGCPTDSGIFVSEERAVRDGKYRLRYRELRTTFEADRAVFAAQRELYETRLKLADQAIQRLQPGWWETHKFQIGTIGGFVLGTAAAIAIFALAR